MNILFVHQNFPAQFRHLATALAADGAHRVVALCINPPAYPTPGVAVVRYQPRRATSATIHPLASDFETKIIRGEAAAAAALQMQASGFNPDLVVAHPGWGEAMFLRDVWPQARFLMFLEFFYRAEGFDMGFDPEFATPGIEARARLRTKNANLLAAFDVMDHALAPTRWQASSLPAWVRQRTSVIFDGIDTGFITPDPAAELALPDGRVLRAGDEVLTFVNRNLEPYRGFHVFMRALPAIQRARPEMVTVIIGGDDVSYGSRPREGTNWREVMLREVGHALDLSRVVFLGRVPYQTYRQVLRVSRVHAYLTYPFVLSWSLMEALAAECLVVASSTPPVTEVIRHGENGLLVDFFDVDAWSQTVSEALSAPQRHRAMTRHAREDVVARYDLGSVCLPQQLELVARLMAA